MADPFAEHKTAQRSSTIQSDKGVAKCVNPDCELFNVDREVAIERSTTKQFAVGIPNLVLNEVTYMRPVNDADYTCPECAFPANVADGPAVNYPTASKA